MDEGRQLKFMFLPEGEDPDTLVRQQGVDDFRHRIDGATSAVEYLFDQLARERNLSVLEDRARLADDAVKYLGRVPSGSPLRQMMHDRLRELTGITGLGMGDGPDQVIRQQQGKQKRVQGSVREEMPQQLLRMLLQMPNLAANLDPADIDLLADGQNSPLLTEVIRYAAAHADADVAQLLGRWSGQEGYDELLQLHQRPLDLDKSLLEVEFWEGLERLRELADRRQRTQLLEQMRDDPAAERERLAEYMALRRGAQAP
jgi:DNA primase